MIIKDFFGFGDHGYSYSTLLHGYNHIGKEHYTMAVASQKRHNRRNLGYFLLWNRNKILSRDLDEKRIFNIQDIYYIKQNEIK